MPIGGNNDTFTITGAKLKVDQGVEVGGSVAYTTDATGFGGVSAQIDNNNTLNITSGKLAGVAKIERNTAATITAITHTNVNNNTTIHLALKNTSTDKGVFITLGTFASDDTVKVNYTDNYLIGPGETGMITLRKVNGVLSLFVREMFTSKATNFDNTDNSPFYIKDGVNYKYPLYKFAGTGLTSEVIQGTTYYKPSAGITTQTRPPKGVPENVVPPTGSFKIGNNVNMTTINYDVYNTANSESGTIYKGSAQKARFVLDLTHNESSGSFTDSGVSSGDTYTLYLDKNATTSTDTTSAVAPNSQPLAVFHNGTFSDGGDPYSHGSITAAATAGYFYSDTASGTYGMGTLTSATYTAASGSSNGDMRNRVEAFTTYVWTPTSDYEADVLVVAGGGGGGADDGGGGGAGGFIEKTNQEISGAQTIVVGDGGRGQTDNYDQTCYAASDGFNSSISGLSLTAIGGGGGGSNHNNQSTERNGRSGGSGGGSSGKNGASGGSGTAGQGFAGGSNSSSNQHYPSGGGGASQAGTWGANATTRSDGGDGKSSDILGTTYWWSGGGGGANHGPPKGKGGKGGGASGANAHGAAGGGDSDTNGVSDAETASGTYNTGWHFHGPSAGKHTGGGGGGGAYHNGDGGKGGSGMVVIKDVGSGKKIAKVKDIVLDPVNEESNVLISTQGTGISTVTYSINGGSEVSTPVSQLSVAHGLNPNTTATILAYALNVSSARLGVKLSRSFTTVLGYETITLTTKSGSQTISYTDNGTTDVTNTYKNAGGNTWNGGWILLTGYTAPVTFEYKASAASSDDGNSYKQIGINDSITQTYASGNTDFDIYHYAYYQSATNFDGSDIPAGNESYVWNSTDSFYIVYKSDGDVEWWQAGTKIKNWSWGTGKTVYLSSTFHKQGNGSDNGSFKNIRVKRRQWDGTKYIN